MLYKYKDKKLDCICMFVVQVDGRCRAGGGRRVYMKGGSGDVVYCSFVCPLERY